MTNDEYRSKLQEIQEALRVFVMLGISISDADLKCMRDTVELADSAGFVHDPTMYRDALYDKRLERQRDILALFAHVRAELRKIFPGDAAFWDALAKEHHTEQEASA